MSEAVLDASALLALVRDEPGADDVTTLLDSAVVSAVNLSEVVAKLADSGMPEAAIYATLEEVELSVVSFDRSHAYAAGYLRPMTRQAGLSFGDRACLALARQLGVPAITTDRRWLELDLDVAVWSIR